MSRGSEKAQGPRPRSLGTRLVRDRGPWALLPIEARAVPTDRIGWLFVRKGLFSGVQGASGGSVDQAVSIARAAARIPRDDGASSLLTGSAGKNYPTGNTRSPRSRRRLGNFEPRNGGFPDCHLTDRANKLAHSWGRAESHRAGGVRLAKAHRLNLQYSGLGGRPWGPASGVASSARVSTRRRSSPMAGPRTCARVHRFISGLDRVADPLLSDFPLPRAGSVPVGWRPRGTEGADSALLSERRGPDDGPRVPRVPGSRSGPSRRSSPAST